MGPLSGLCPTAPHWVVDWRELWPIFDWLGALDACPQDPRWHAEGDVGIHTRMVVDALVASPTWRVRGEWERLVLFAAALLHDVAKPETTRTEESGRITARHHSERGAIRARRILWELGAPPAMREIVAHLVAMHQQPFFAIEREDSERIASRASWTAGADRLVELARADVLGRVCDDRERLLEHIALFEEQCRELRCLDAPRVFPSDAHRVAYFTDATRTFDAPVAPVPRCTVIVLSGLPAAGKDHWIRRHGGALPVIAPDEVRRELRIDPRDEQGLVVQTCRERARVHLRAGEDFLWNATNLSRRVRGQVLDLCHAYGARTHVVCVEATPKELHERNGARAIPVPSAAMERMLSRWEAADGTEAFEVEFTTQR
jgi:predicted kinase